VAGFIAAQFAGALVAVLYMRWQSPVKTEQNA
jgi:hypothetical protein